MPIGFSYSDVGDRGRKVICKINRLMARYPKLSREEAKRIAEKKTR
jgi:hypothetical protein